MKTNNSFNVLDKRNNKQADYLYQLIKNQGINFATGVPCGVQRHIIRNLIEDNGIKHVSANRESEAIGIATGAYFAGMHPMVYMQNSGFFGASNDIASLLLPYKIPMFLSVTWRGCNGEDAPQHLATGKATIALVKSLGIRYEVFDNKKSRQIITNLFKAMRTTQMPVVLLLTRGWNQ